MAVTDPNTPTPRRSRPPLWQRILFAIPIIGWILRDVGQDENNAVWGFATIIAGWGCAVLLFGYAGLIIYALFMVVTMFLFILLISRG